MSEVLVGVLALQGDFGKHAQKLTSIGVQVQEVRSREELEKVQGLIIPGGESTVMLKLLDQENLREPLKAFGQKKPLFGTCAGLILMSRAIQHSPLSPLGLLDVDIERNAFGRQADSFEVEIEAHLSFSHKNTLPAFFIRAPKIKRCGHEVSVLAYFEEEPILVRQGSLLAASFHPELTEDASIHRYFLEMIASHS